jgi:hypothetical protein
MRRAMEIDEAAWAWITDVAGDLNNLGNGCRKDNQPPREAEPPLPIGRLEIS